MGEVWRGEYYSLYEVFATSEVANTSATQNKIKNDFFYK